MDVSYLLKKFKYSGNVNTHSLFNLPHQSLIEDEKKYEVASSSQSRFKSLVGGDKNTKKLK